MSARRPSPALVFLLPPALAAGAAVGWWLYKRWGYPVHADEREVAHVEAPPEAEGPGLQHAEGGAGPRFHRRYSVRVREAEWSPEQLIADVGADFGPYVAPELARFERETGDEGRLSPGDEFLVHINGPWNGPVRVVESEPARFVLATREGHMEAGQIEFRAEPLPPTGGASGSGGLLFTIESWARSRDELVDVAYDDLGVAKGAQQAMWTFFCEQVATRAGGEIDGEVEVLTEREAAP